MKIHNKNSLFLSVIGGALLIISGASGAIAVIDELAYALHQLFGFSIAFGFESIMGFMAVMTIIAGVIAIIGGFILTTDKVWIGRAVLLGAIAAGVVGLLMSLVQLVMIGTIVMDMTTQLQQSIGWVGAIVAFVARIIADQKPMMSPTS